jgi:hypothetical protein
MTTIWRARPCRDFRKQKIRWANRVGPADFGSPRSCLNCRSQSFRGARCSAIRTSKITRVRVRSRGFNNLITETHGIRQNFDNSVGCWPGGFASLPTQFYIFIPLDRPRHTVVKLQKPLMHFQFVENRNDPMLPILEIGKLSKYTRRRRPTATMFPHLRSLLCHIEFWLRWAG